MKSIRFFLFAVMALSLITCKKDPLDSYPAELLTSKTNLTSAFETLNADMATVATALVDKIDDPAAIRAELLGLFNRSTFVMEFAYVTPEGILEIIEPAIYHSSEGADISQQDHIVKIFSTKKPVLSNIFYAVEGFYAAVDVHPIVSNDQVLGGITALFLPEEILGSIMEPLLENQTFELWVMETNGNMIYNQDVGEIGLNLFTDPLYKPFPELITAAEKIAAEDHGETTYSFYQTGTQTTVVKKTYWITCAINDTEWKLVWVKPE